MIAGLYFDLGPRKRTVFVTHMSVSWIPTTSAVRIQVGPMALTGFTWYQGEQESEGGMIRLETLIELKFINSSCLSLSPY